MIEFFFDCSSPWTYLAFHNIQPLAAELGAAIRWRPFRVGGVCNSVNPSVYFAREHPVPAKQAYQLKDMQDWARHTGLAIKFPPSVFPVNSVKAMRGCILLEPQAKLVPFARAVFEAYWGDDRDISSDAVLAEADVAMPREARDGIGCDSPRCEDGRRDPGGRAGEQLERLPLLSAQRRQRFLTRDRDRRHPPRFVRIGTPATRHRR